MLFILGTYSWVAVAVAVLLLLVVCMWILEFYQAVTAGVGVFTLVLVIGKYRIQQTSMPDGITESLKFSTIVQRKGKNQLILQGFEVHLISAATTTAKNQCHDLEILTKCCLPSIA